MSERGGAVHVVTTRRTYKGRVYETHLLRRSYRDGDRVKNETLGNLSHLPAPVIDLVRRALRGETFVPVAERLEVLGSRPHGHVQAVRVAMQRLGIESLIGTRPSPERDRILALIAARVLAPHTKLATTRWWHTSTLAEEFGVSSADEDDLYAAMDWLLERQPAIERKLAAGTWAKAAWRSTIYPPATSRARTVRWAKSAIAATARRTSCRSTMD